MKTEELIRYYKANIEAIEKGLNNDSLSADKKFRLGYTQQALDGYKSALQELLGNNNDREDIVISILENGSGQIQEAFVNVNIYVKDNIRNGEAEMNDARCRELCKVAIQVLETGHGESYRFTLNKQRVLEVNGKNEHFINNKLLYSFNNE